MSDIAAVSDAAHPPRAVRQAARCRWPLGLLAAAVVIFVFYYLDRVLPRFAPGRPARRSSTTWLPLQAVNEALVYVMCALGLNIVVGYAGLLDLGFVAFWAIGGYTAGWLMSGFFSPAELPLLRLRVHRDRQHRPASTSTSGSC